MDTQKHGNKEKLTIKYHRIHSFFIYLYLSLCQRIYSLHIINIHYFKLLTLSPVAINLFFHLYIFSIYLFLLPRLFIFLNIYLTVSLSFFLSVYWSILFLNSIFLIIFYLFNSHPSLPLFIYLSVYSIFLSFYPSIYPCI